MKEQRLKEKKEQEEKLQQLQNGQSSLSPEEEEPPSERIMGLDLSMWEDPSYQQRERSLQILSSKEEDGREHAVTKESITKVEAEVIPTATVVVREKSRTVDEPNQKTTRAKRESRRMRELEQAKFSLELLKVRATSGGATSPSDERRWSVELMPSITPPLRSPQGTPDSQSSKGSFELLSMEDEAPKAVEEVTDSEDALSPPPPDTPEPEPEPEPRVEVVSTSPKPNELQRTEISEAVDEPSMKSSSKIDLTPRYVSTHPPKIENYLPTFYVPASESSVVVPQRQEEPQQTTDASISTTTTTTTVTKSVKEKRESTRRPVVVVISMQKETPLSEELSDIIRPPVEVRDSAAQTGDFTPSPLKTDPVPALQADPAVIEKLVRLNEEKEVRQRNQQQQNEKEMMEQIRQQKEALERQRLFFAQFEREMFEKQRGEALNKIQQSRQAGQEIRAAATSGKPIRPSSLLIERTASLTPHARTQSDSTPPRLHSPPGGDVKSGSPRPQLPPPPASAPRERRRPPAEGWAPKLTLETKDGATRARTGNRKLQSNQGTALNMKDKPGNIFFSPKDKVTFAK